MKELPDILDEKVLEELEKQGKALFFNYLGDLEDFSNVSEEDLLKVLDGKVHALIGTNLYVKAKWDYEIHIEDWVETDEAKKYVPLLLKVFYDKRKEYFSKYFSKHLN